MSKFSPARKSSLKKKKHWSSRVHDSVISRSAEGLFNVVIDGGGDYGEFPCIGDIKQDKIAYMSGKLHQEEILLEVNGQQVAGLTRQDVCRLIRESPDPLSLRTVKTGSSITKELRPYLGARFEKGTVDHDLQQTIRDNLYTRTVPCTTREPRPGETPGVEYNFLTVDQFMVLEKSGNLLESGLFDGNYYGTPKPPHEPPGQDKNQPEHGGAYPGEEHLSFGQSQQMNGAPMDRYYMPQRRSHAQPNRNLGPLPRNWEIAYTEGGDKYYIDHTAGTTQWLDPRVARMQRPQPLQCTDDELPHGWEKVDDVKYGVYYIDYINGRTTMENPVARSRRIGSNDIWAVERGGTEQQAPPPPPPPPGMDGEEQLSPNQPHPQPGMQNFPPQHHQQQQQPMQQQPQDNKGEILEQLHQEGEEQAARLNGMPVEVRLKKPSTGFGFTVVGGETPRDLKQIKNIVPNSVAAQSGRLQIGDVLVRVNDLNVMLLTHDEVVRMFQEVPVGGDVSLEVRRGYPLRAGEEGGQFTANGRPGPEATNGVGMVPIPPRAPTNKARFQPSQPGFERLIAHVVKGPFGFGFTIADSNLGQAIKQILDAPRCQQLREDDLLVEINGHSVFSATHNQVVSILKSCEKGSSVEFLIERGTGMVTATDGPAGVSDPAGQQFRIPDQPRFPGSQPPTHPGQPGPVATSGESSQNATVSHTLERPGDYAGGPGNDGVLYFEIELHRQVSGFGFRILGGLEEGSQVRVGTIVPGGAADLDGRLRVEDEIVEINGQSVLNETHRNVVSLMSGAGVHGRVTLGIQRSTQRQTSSSEVDSRDPAGPASGTKPLTRDVILERRPNEGFGFVLQSHVQESVCSICRLVPDSPAELCNKLKIGDRIVGVNGGSVVGMPHSDVVAAIKRAGLRVVLQVDNTRGGGEHGSNHQSPEPSNHQPVNQWQDMRGTLPNQGAPNSIQMQQQPQQQPPQQQHQQQYNQQEQQQHQYAGHQGQQSAMYRQQQQQQQQQQGSYTQQYQQQEPQQHSMLQQELNQRLPGQQSRQNFQGQQQQQYQGGYDQSAQYAQEQRQHQQQQQQPMAVSQQQLNSHFQPQGVRNDGQYQPNGGYEQQQGAQGENPHLRHLEKKVPPPVLPRPAVPVKPPTRRPPPPPTSQQQPGYEYAGPSSSSVAITGTAGGGALPAGGISSAEFGYSDAPSSYSEEAGQHEMDAYHAAGGQPTYQQYDETEDMNSYPMQPPGTMESQAAMEQQQQQYSYGDQDTGQNNGELESDNQQAQSLQYGHHEQQRNEVPQSDAGMDMRYQGDLRDQQQQLQHQQQEHQHQLEHQHQQFQQQQQQQQQQQAEEEEEEEQQRQQQQQQEQEQQQQQQQQQQRPQQPLPSEQEESYDPNSRHASFEQAVQQQALHPSPGHGDHDPSPMSDKARGSPPADPPPPPPPQPSVVEIILKRNRQGYGFSIRGGQEYRNSPLYVLRVADGGAASQDGRLQAGDRILEINSVDTTSMKHADAIGIIKRGGDTLRLLVEQPVSGSSRPHSAMYDSQPGSMLGIDSAASTPMGSSPPAFDSSIAAGTHTTGSSAAMPSQSYQQHFVAGQPQRRPTPINSQLTNTQSTYRTMPHQPQQQHRAGPASMMVTDEEAGDRGLRHASILTAPHNPSMMSYQQDHQSQQHHREQQKQQPIDGRSYGPGAEQYARQHQQQSLSDYPPPSSQPPHQHTAQLARSQTLPHHSTAPRQQLPGHRHQQQQQQQPFFAQNRPSVSEQDEPILMTRQLQQSQHYC